MPRILQMLLAIVLAGIILFIGRSLFIPLSFALLISFILYPVCKWMEQKGINGTLAILFSLFMVTVLLGGIIFLLISQLNNFGSEWPLLQNKLLLSYQQFSDYLDQEWHITDAQQQIWLKQFVENSTTHLFGLLQQTISTSIVSLILMLLIPIYSFLVLFYRERLLKALVLLLPNNYRTGLTEIILLTIDSYYGFIKGMLIVYLIVGLLNSLGLFLLGIPHAFLFGCIAAILTFIPYVGIIVASLFPITLAWVTYNSFWYPIGVILIFTVVQYLEANVIFPWAVARKLNLNTLMTIVAIITGGILWGAAGMILFVPFAAILKLVAERVNGGEGLAVLLGDGKIQ